MDKGTGALRPSWAAAGRCGWRTIGRRGWRSGAVAGGVAVRGGLHGAAGCR
jgi:hypothetical protein